MRQHTFGGLGMMGRLIDFDTDDGFGDGLIADAGLDDTGAEIAPPDGGDPAAAAGPGGDAGAGDEFGITQEMWNELVGSTQQSSQFVSEVMSAIEQEQQTAQAAAARGEEQARIAGLDWSDPEQAMSEVERRASALSQQHIAEVLGPYQPLLDNMAQQEGERMVRAELDQIAGEIGEFDRNHALIVANAFLANNVEPSQAFRQAAAITLQREQEIRKEAVEAYLESMRAAGDAPPAPHLGSGAAHESPKVEYDPRDPDKYEKVAQDWARRQKAAREAGSSVIG